MKLNEILQYWEKEKNSSDWQMKGDSEKAEDAMEFWNEHIEHNGLQGEKRKTNTEWTEIQLNDPEGASAIKDYFFNFNVTTKEMPQPQNMDELVADPEYNFDLYDEQQKNISTPRNLTYEDKLRLQRDPYTRETLQESDPKGRGSEGVSPQPVDDGDDYYWITKQPKYGSTVDKESDISMAGRLAAGTFKGTPEQKLQFLKQEYPDARIIKNNQGEFGHFEVLSPQTGRWTMVNTDEFTAGDIAGATPEIIEATSGAVGYGMGGMPGALIGGAASDYLTPKVVGGILNKNLDARTPVEKVYGATEAGVRTALFEKGGRVVSDALSKAGKRVVRGSKESVAYLQRTMKDLKEIGDSLYSTIGAMSGRLQGFERFISGVPGTGGVFARQSRQMLKSGQETIQKIVDGSIGKIDFSLNPNIVGEKVRKNVELGVKGFKKYFNREYNKLNELFPNDEVFPINATLEKINSMVRPESIKNFSKVRTILRSKGLARIDRALRKDLGVKIKDIIASTNPDVNIANMTGLNFKTMRALRSFIGSRLTNLSITDDIARGELKQVYGALTQDMRKMVATKGEKALKQFDDLTSNYQKFIKANDEVFDKIQNQFENTKIFSNLENDVLRGFGNSLSAIKKALSQSEWNIARAAIIKRMGRPADAAREVTGTYADDVVFDFQIFKKNYNKIIENPKIKDMLFGKEYGKNLEILAQMGQRVLDHMPELAKGSSKRGFAGTGGFTMLGVGATSGLVQGDILGTILGGLGGGTLFSGGSYLASKAVTNPKLAKWLAEGAKAKTRGQVTKWLARFYGQTEDQDVILSFMQTLKQLGLYSQVSKAEAGQNESQRYGKRMNQMKRRLLNTPMGIGTR
jgi:hypothetical protein